MPWMETTPMIEREKFIVELLSGRWNMSELCRRHQVSRRTGYKWLARFESEGIKGLEDRSRAPKSCPHRTDEEIQQQILAVKRKRPTWGARMIRNHLIYMTQTEASQWPAESTINALLKREGLVRSKKRRKRPQHPGRPRVEAKEANDVWTADFKGHFRTKNHVYCYPLTVVDLHSRFLLCCKGLLSICHDDTQPVFERLFRRYGLPRAILTDNGVPFCSPTAILGLSALDVWWMRLGIRHLRISLGKPQQNGAHERMHRTLKAETTKPPGKDLHAQQRKFDPWRKRYNYERPHQAIGDVPPIERWSPSPRPYPSKIPEPEYPAHFQCRLVSNSGDFRFKGGQYFITKVLAGYYVALEEIDDGLWSIHFCNTELARLDERASSVIQ